MGAQGGKSRPSPINSLKIKRKKSAICILRGLFAIFSPFGGLSCYIFFFMWGFFHHVGAFSYFSLRGGLIAISCENLCYFFSMWGPFVLMEGLFLGLPPLLRKFLPSLMPTPFPTKFERYSLSNLIPPKILEIGRRSNNFRVLFLRQPVKGLVRLFNRLPAK